jgi:hypothetical protein
MDNTNTNLNPFDNNTIQKIQEGGIYYYILPEGLPLFKASTIYDEKSPRLIFKRAGPYFFGVKNMNPEYIESYEAEYGIIHEFRTNRQYKLLALDDITTQKHIYENANTEIQDILEKNYGYNDKNLQLKRDSESDNDRILSQYLCSNADCDGYAVHNMTTYGVGLFHDEFMICKMDGIEYVEQITKDTTKIQNILQGAELKRHAKNMKESRQKKRPYNSFNSSPIKIRGNLFGKQRSLFEDDDDDDILNNGGNKKRTYKKRLNKKRKTNKRKSYRKSKR